MCAFSDTLAASDAARIQQSGRAAGLLGKWAGRGKNVANPGSRWAFTRRAPIFVLEIAFA